ncbi:tRNA pseudouridine(38-40) synthase TruA [Halorubrum halodurans]|uniref:tRNA pseudouridine synthase A n=1 Tax=Halorubrum halodurans TaxID=1383851 RepID=A0A256IKM7_9EURY|nr:tRNA pseudouridine(38-40) synthase TruA [Halorubrum halodurans]OYR57101.1 tRNA pseudouridine(38-40) synthase TruA [Halorubrum halodurans]
MRAFRVAYDGRAYAGFQRQPHAETVEGTLLAALSAHGLLERGDGPTHATPPGYAAAGRTDAGVSAVAQTVAFEAPAWLTPRAFNGRLPGSIRVWAAADVGSGFHATHDAVRRTYRYYLYAPTDPIRIDRPGDRALDDGAVHDALARLSGAHDFHNLTSDDDGTVRDLRTNATREGEFLVVEAVADGFPRALVRRLVGAAEAVGRGTADPTLLDRLLADEPVPGEYGVGPAAPEPLVLWNVAYDGVDFAVDEEAAASAVAAFDERHRDARRIAATTRAIRDRIGESGPGSAIP